MMYEAREFLSTHRALAVCSREFGRLTEAIVHQAKAFAGDRLDGPPVIRQSPDRCIVQLGPVALTVAWLRNGSDTPADGSLMAIVWRGVIAPRGDHSPERKRARVATATPVSVWEQTLLPQADSEATWMWIPESSDQGAIASTGVATQCMEQLKVALQAATADDTAEMTHQGGRH